MSATAGARALRPASPDEARQIVRDAAERGEAIYPLGGGTALESLLPKTREGIDLSLAGSNQIVEFSHRDLTITIQAGVTLATLAETVREKNLLFPFASPLSGDATIGGLIATAWHGPRRTGWGNLRDYVIGIRAIDGRGVAFKSGGKVVKNVAGYDFCKLLVGSHGTLSVLTEATLRLRPRPESALMATLSAPAGTSLASVHEAFASPAIPYSTYEIVRGGANGASPGMKVFVAWEGPSEETAAARQAMEELERSGRLTLCALTEGAEFEAALAGVAAEPIDAAFAIQVQAPPTTTLRALTMHMPANPSVLVVVRPRVGQARLIWPMLNDPAAALATLATLRREIGEEGYVSVLVDRTGLAPTRELRFGRTSSPQFLMDRVKATLDPRRILNPGRYVFADSPPGTA